MLTSTIITSSIIMLYSIYVQCDEESKSGKTITPVNFEVSNGLVFYYF